MNLLTGCLGPDIKMVRNGRSSAAKSPATTVAGSFDEPGINSFSAFFLSFQFEVYPCYSRPSIVRMIITNSKMLSLEISILLQCYWKFDGENLFNR